MMDRWAAIWRRRSLRAAGIAALCLASTMAHASAWLDNSLGELKPEQRVSVAHPASTQVLLEWQRDGTSYPRATKYFDPMVRNELKDTGVVGELSDTPLPSGTRLSILINDVGDKGAAGKGFAAGLTLGLAGVVAADNYTVDIDYVPVAGAPPIHRTLHHRIVFKFGNATVPTGVVKVKDLNTAVKMMLHQVIAHGMNQIAADPSFPGSSPPTPSLTPATSPSPEPTAS